MHVVVEAYVVFGSLCVSARGRTVCNADDREWTLLGTAIVPVGPSEEDSLRDLLALACESALDIAYDPTTRLRG